MLKINCIPKKNYRRVYVKKNPFSPIETLGLLLSLKQLMLLS